MYDSASKGDALNLRCFDQKRRFGIDFLYPVDRYVTGLLRSEVPVVWNDLSNRVPNPIYSDLSGSGTAVRGSELVVFAGIVGIPWQLIGSDDGSGRLVYKNAQQIRSEGLWDQIVGSCPSGEVSGQCCSPDGITNGRCDMEGRQVRRPPLEGLMVPTTADRAAIGLTSQLAPLQPASAMGELANPINGHEWNIVDLNDLQYACIFPLARERDCRTVGTSCDCTGGQSEIDNARKPLCQQDASFSHVQRFAKAYPTIRILEVMKGLGDHAVPASICARNVHDPSAPDFGYVPAIDAIVRAIAPRLE